MTNLLPLITAVLLGFIHAVDVDHAVAVSAFVSTRPSLAVAARFGLRWALGHSFTVLAAGSVLLILGVRWSPAVDVWVERLIGATLVGVGIWAMRSLRNLHFHGPPGHGDHAHLHVHGKAPPRHDHPHAADRRQHHHHPRGIAAVGMLHGLAGTSGVLALVPVSLADSRTLGVAYLLLFCAGVVAGMVLFATVVAFALTRTAGRSVQWGRRFATGIAMSSVVIGAFWLFRP